jgi:hypothetical protein
LAQKCRVQHGALESLAGTELSVAPVCEHTFVTSQGSPRARFQRALASGNPTLVAAAAAEIGHLSLDDALAVCLAFLPSDPQRFDRAVVRWHGRYCVELRPSTDEAQLVLAAMRALDGPTRAAAAAALLGLFERRGLRHARRQLSAWLNR